jgi:5-methylthioadenosine/S-adenosylhomocysteine deaminase
LSLTVTNTRYDSDIVALRVDRSTIVAFGPDVRPAEGDEVIDAGGMHLAAPLVNGHTHAAMTLFRGFGDDLPLPEWLETKIWPAEAR